MDTNVNSPIDLLSASLTTPSHPSFLTWPSVTRHTRLTNTDNISTVITQQQHNQQQDTWNIENKRTNDTLFNFTVLILKNVPQSLTFYTFWLVGFDRTWGSKCSWHCWQCGVSACQPLLAAHLSPMSPEPGVRLSGARHRRSEPEPEPGPVSVWQHSGWSPQWPEQCSEWEWHKDTMLVKWFKWL